MARLVQWSRAGNSDSTCGIHLPDHEMRRLVTLTHFCASGEGSVKVQLARFPNEAALTRDLTSRARGMRYSADYTLYSLFSRYFPLSRAQDPLRSIRDPLALVLMAG